MGSLNMIFSVNQDFCGAWVRQVFVMLIEKVLFIITMQKFVTSNIRHLRIKKKP